jgi:hypothetical protein
MSACGVSLAALVIRYIFRVVNPGFVDANLTTSSYGRRFIMLRRFDLHRKEKY